jgi:hypothetical protein
MPVYWYEVQQIKKHLENCSDMVKANGRRRAKEHFDRVQKEMDSGLRRDTRPHGAQTVHTYPYPPLLYDDSAAKITS